MNRSGARVVVMGVSGSGKSTVAELLAERLDAAYVDGDDLHPPANVDKMIRGMPLDDDDRSPWLVRVGEWLHQQDPGRHAVVACSALKRKYRDIIRIGASDATFVHLHGPDAVLLDRQSRRKRHFMPTTLMESQLAALEPLMDDEYGATFSVELTPEAIVLEITEQLHLRPAD